MGAAPSLIVGTDAYDGKGFMYQGGEDILDDCEFFNKNNITHVVGICHRSVGRHVFGQTKLTPDTVFPLPLLVFLSGFQLIMTNRSFTLMKWIPQQQIFTLTWRGPQNSFTLPE